VQRVLVIVSHKFEKFKFLTGNSSERPFKFFTEVIFILPSAAHLMLSDLLSF
jgi:hypothetical protein